MIYSVTLVIKADAHILLSENMGACLHCNSWILTYAHFDCIIV